MKWIRCSDTMPPVNKQVLAYGPVKGELAGGVSMEICVWDGDAWWDEGGTELSRASVWGDTGWTHWMPLPEQPKDNAP